MLLGSEKHIKEPEKIVMKNFNLNVDGDNELPEPPKHLLLQKLLDEYSENSSVENGSLCELNCIPCYNGDRYSPSYYQKLQYYTTVGKDECPRIFDYHQYSTFNEQCNNSSPLKQLQFKNPSNYHDCPSESQPTIPLNNSLNLDNNESYYSDTSVETNTTLNIPNNEPTYFIRISSKVDDNQTPTTTDNTPSTPTSIPTPAPTPLQKLKEVKLRKKTFNLFKKSHTPSPIQNEIKNHKDANLNDISTSNENPTACDTVTINDLANKVNDININMETFNTYSSNTKASTSSSSISSSSSKQNNKNDEVKTTQTNKNQSITSKKHPSSISKYDFVKVLVYLSDEHYYVLSRFLISRMLTATKIDYFHAVRIALDLKKRLVDCNELELSQRKLEKTLFSIMKDYGYNEKYTSLYKLISG